jgi:hypothetical protein
MTRYQKPLDHRLSDGTLTIRLLPESLAARAIRGTMAAIAAGNWDGKSRIAPLKKAKKNAR